MRLASLVFALVLIALPALTRADDDKVKAEKKPAENVDKKTADILKKVGVLYRDAKSMQADAAINTTLSKGEQKREVKVKATIVMQKPNNFALRAKNLTDEKGGLEIICDGKNLITVNNRLKQYTEGKPPKDLMGVGRGMMQFGHPTTGMLYQNVLADDPEAALLEGVTKGEHAGMEKVDGKDAHHLKFEQDDFTWELWVAAEGQPFVLKASSTHPRDDGSKMVTVETYTNWKHNAEPAKDAFAFKPSEDFKKVKMFGPQDDG